MQVVCVCVLVALLPRLGRSGHLQYAIAFLRDSFPSSQAALPNPVTESVEQSGTFRGGFPGCLFNAAEKSFDFTSIARDRPARLTAQPRMRCFQCSPSATACTAF